MPIENDVKEIDIEPPKPAMTYDQYIRLVQRREEIQHDKYLQMFSELQERLEKLQRYQEETQKIFEETERYREETQTEFNNRFDAIMKDHELYKAKYIKQPEPEPAAEIRELKEQVIELKAENEDLRNKICQLWELLTSFFRNKITPVTKGFNSFFSKSKNSSSPEHPIKIENNSSANSF